MVSSLRGVSKFVSGYKAEVLLKGLPILSMDPLLTGVSNFVNGYVGETLVNGVANFIKGFFVKRGF